MRRKVVAMRRRSRSDGAFEFVNLAYVWHFTNVVVHRSLVIQEVWRRVAGHYPGASVDGAPGEPA